MLTLAIQKSGRLSEKTLRLLSECGIDFPNGSKDTLQTTAVNFPMRLLFLRDDDIPECVSDELTDIGIVGENVYLEKEKKVTLAKRLGFARCRLSIAVPKEMNYHSVADIENQAIATSYPRILKRFLDDNNVNAQIREINGSVEIAPGIGLSDVIFDVVSTGSTLMSNGLREVQTVLNSEAVLIAGKNLSTKKQKLLNKLIFRIEAVQKAARTKYILLNAPNENLENILKILPGMKSPTIMPLAVPGWSSLHSVIREDDFWEIIENLKQNGAEGILVIPIEKMIL